MSAVDELTEAQVIAIRDRLDADCQQLRLFFLSDGTVGDIPRHYQTLLICGHFRMSPDQVEAMDDVWFGRAISFVSTYLKALTVKAEAMRARENAIAVADAMRGHVIQRPEGEARVDP